MGGDMVDRNGCAFSGNTKEPNCSGSDFDNSKGCAVLVNAETETGSSALNLPDGDLTSYEQLHGNWIKSADCEYADVPAFGPRKTVNCTARRSCKSRRLRGDAPPPSSLTVHPAR